MTDKRTFFKQLLGAALVAVAPPLPVVGALSTKPRLDIEMLITAKMAAHIQAELDRDLMMDLYRIATGMQCSPKQLQYQIVPLSATTHETKWSFVESTVE